MHEPSRPTVIARSSAGSLRPGARILLGALVAGALALPAACGGGGGSGTPADSTSSPLSAAQRSQLHLVTVEPDTFRASVSTTGTVDFDGDRSTQVMAPISGPVSRVLVSLGARVRRGQPLAVVASPDFASAVADYRKGVAEATNARRIADMDRKLFAIDAIARQEMQDAETRAEAAEADRDAALQALVSLGVDSASLAAVRRGEPVTAAGGIIRAPLPGILVERLITPGQLLEAGGTPCFTVADVSRVWVQAHVFDTDLPNVQVGDSAEIRPTNGADVYRGRVDNVGAEVDPDTRATSVRVVAENPGAGLKRGMYVQVTILGRSARTGLLVPSSAVLRDEDNLPFVFVAGDDGDYRRQLVKLGQEVGDRREIASGLQPGQRVVAEGALFLQFAEAQ
ncbi:MAG: efflux RND transporter periplasmic adaptor subunit [Candidatus Palauibacterales bacterium]|nr:efflux RND transporter periplasmic adaptor subunit [Candidatus Palauibacterales bacterium]MDP2530116.1 efflux RND transporter periplasmic adaptor subunit [Candidatus Palauibacterales bacterium]MDP2582573.1 efflux RND transporter periplasmic adaptor subunit [Candidatus Palauibacterales bacterium]